MRVVTVIYLEPPPWRENERDLATTREAVSIDREYRNTRWRDSDPARATAKIGTGFSATQKNIRREEREPPPAPPHQIDDSPRRVGNKNAVGVLQVLRAAAAAELVGRERGPQRRDERVGARADRV